MKTRTNQSGFSVVEIGIVLAVVAIIGFLGYVFYNNQMNKTDSDDSAQSVTTSEVESAPVINDVADLDEAEAVLDQTDPSDSNTTDTSKLDAELSNF